MRTILSDSPLLALHV